MTKIFIFTLIMPRFDKCEQIYFIFGGLLFGLVRYTRVLYTYIRSLFKI